MVSSVDSCLLEGGKKLRAFYHITKLGDCLIQYTDSEHITRFLDLISRSDIGKAHFGEVLILSRITSPIKIKTYSDEGEVFKCLDADEQPFDISFGSDGKVITVTRNSCERHFIMTYSGLCFSVNNEA